MTHGYKCLKNPKLSLRTNTDRVKNVPPDAVSPRAVAKAPGLLGTGTQKALLLTALLASAGARADLLVLYTEDQINNRVTGTVSGSLDTAPIIAASTSTQLFDAVVGNTAVSQGGFRFSPQPFLNAVNYTLGNFYIPFVNGVNVIGDYTPVQGDLPIVVQNNGGADQIRIAQSYVSGAPYSSRGVWPNKRFSDLGITGGADVVMDLPGNQKLTIRFATILPTPVPTLSQWALMLLAAGLALLGMRQLGRQPGLPPR